MNPDTIKLLIWAAMHHPEFPRIRFEPFLEFSAYATEAHSGFAVGIKKFSVKVPLAIALEYGIPGYLAGYQDEF